MRLCVPGMGAFGLRECKPLILRVKVPYGQGWDPEPLVPRKGVAGNRKSEGIPNAFGKTPVLTNSPIGMPLAEPYKRLSELDESRKHSG